MDESYGAVVGGKLKLKGRSVPALSSNKRKKKRHKKKHKKKSKDHDREDEGLKRLRDAGSGEKAEEKPAESKEEAAAEKMGLELGLTPAQIAFERNRQRRLKDTLKDQVQLSYRDKIEKANEYLASLPDHFDIPKVAAAGNG